MNAWDRSLWFLLLMLGAGAGLAHAATPPVAGPDGDMICSAIEKHLSQIEWLTNWALLLAIIAGWSAWNGHDDFSVLGLKIPTITAYPIVATLFFVINGMLVLYLCYLAELFKSVPNDKLMKAVQTTGTHTWLLNPFRTGGDNWFSRGLLNLAPGLLFCVWWACVLSAGLLRKLDVPKLSVIFFFCCVLSAVSMAGAFGRVIFVVFSRLYVENLDLFRQEAPNVCPFVAVSLVGLIGGGAFTVVLLRRPRKTPL